MNTMLAVYIAASLIVLSIVNGQLTFSQGWGKRSDSLTKSKSTKDNDNDMTTCAAQHAKALYNIHQLMMDTYEQYNQCRSKTSQSSISREEDNVNNDKFNLPGSRRK